MDDKKKYNKTDFDNYALSVRREYEQTLMRQRERIDELKTALSAAERKIAEYEKQKELVYKAITAALKKADDIERVSLIKYNQEIAQLKSFHDKWVGYFNRILAAYPLDDELAAASKAGGKIAEVLDRAGDIEKQYAEERDRLMTSLEDEDGVAATEQQPRKKDDYADRSPAGFSIAEALHPKEDLKDIMRELGIIIDD
ncbi:MAG: hypothetical protein HDT28_02595 [Clostridiales bacterium]|nr:hypothetical protein [Clostridiales bacterium]